jgi:hypothetical protein
VTSAVPWYTVTPTNLLSATGCGGSAGRVTGAGAVAGAGAGAGCANVDADDSSRTTKATAVAWRMEILPS